MRSIIAVALCAVGFAAWADDPEGSKDNPWEVGSPNQEDVKAWTNGTGRLDISVAILVDESAMMDFDVSAPWAGDAVTEGVIDSDVTAIGANAFAGCTALKTLVLYAEEPPTLGGGNDLAGVKIFVPEGTADAYRANAQWAVYAAQIDEMYTKKKKSNELTKHLHDITYKWWDAVKAKDVGEKLARIMSGGKLPADDDYFFPYQAFDWYKGFLPGALCTSCRNGNFVGRNFDWGYDDVDECVLHIPAAEGRLASVGVASWFFPQWLQDLLDVDEFLPELTMDGVNEKGVAINVNVVPGGDNGWTVGTNSNATKRLNAGFAVRTVLDNATNAAHAVEILQSRNIYSLKPLEFHWMISDATESYVVECASNALIVLKAHDARPKMSNFYVTHSPSVGEYDVLTNGQLTAGNHTPHAMGIERYANVSNGLEGVDSVEAMYTHMTNVWYKLKYLKGNETKYWSDMNGAPVPGRPGESFEFGDDRERADLRLAAFREIQANYVAVTNYEAQTGKRTIDPDDEKWKWLTNGVVHTVHTSIYDIEKRMLRVVVQEDASYSRDAYLTPVTASAVSAEGFLDLTVGDRVAQDEELLVVDPKWGDAETAWVKLHNGWTRTYDCASNDLWQTAALTPGRYDLALRAGTGISGVLYGASFWKTGADWVVLDLPPYSDQGIQFQSNKTYLVLEAYEFAPDSRLIVLDGAKFEYGAGAGFKGGAPELPKRYAFKGDTNDLYQIVEKIKGSADNPWVVGDDGETLSLRTVEAYTNGSELVIQGYGTVKDISEIPGAVVGAIETIRIAEATVTGAASGTFAGYSDFDLTLPDGWQGELPGAAGWYGATGVELTRVPLAVKNVKPQQRYPWNGLVDVTYDLTGEGTVAVAVLVTADGKKLANPTVDGETTFDLGTGAEKKGLKLIWDAQADFGDEGVHEKIKVKLTVEQAE